MSPELPFVILKFLPTDSDPKEYIEVGLSKWLIDELDDNMKGMTKWPPENRNISNLVKMEQTCDQSWASFPVEVKRFYETFVKAREAATRFVDDSNYETEGDVPMGRGHRAKKRRILESSSDDDLPLRATKVSIPPPPPVSVDVEKTAKVTVKSSKAGYSRKPVERKQARKELMDRISAAKEVVAARTKNNFGKESNVGGRWPLNISPLKSPSRGSETGIELGLSKSQGGMTSPWKVSELEFNADNPSTPLSLSAESHPQRDSQSPNPKASSSGLCMSSAVVQDDDDDDDHLSSFQAPASQTLTFNAAVGTKSSHCRELFSHSRNDVTIDDRFNTLESKVERSNVHILEVSSKCDIMLMNMGRLLRTVMPNEKRVSRPPQMPALPLDSKEELNEFEKFLGSDDVNLAAVVDYMSSFVKIDHPEAEKKSTTNILSKLVTNNLGKVMNLDGGKGKVAFRALNVYKVLQGTIQQAFPKSDLFQSDRALYSWLKDSKWRKRGSGQDTNKISNLK